MKPIVSSAASPGFDERDLHALDGQAQAAADDKASRQAQGLNE